MDNIIYTACIGNNSKLIKDVTALYFNKGDIVADVTYGRGVFWREVSGYEIIGSDIKTGMDFSNLPYANNSFNHSVIDPPYGRKSLQGMISCYNTSNTAKHEDIIKMYADGLKELVRITKPNGYILCKCQDEVCGGKQQWSHIEIKEIAEQLGLYTKDLFILVNMNRPKVTHRQQHARKIHSYLWVFQKRKTNTFDIVDIPGVMP